MTRPLSFVGAALTLAAAGLFFLPASQEQVRERTPHEWELRMREVGPAEAYEEFKKGYADAPFEDQHGNAHLIGDLLYRIAGIDGLSVCDESFAFGCYHSFFGAFLADHGTASVNELAEACREKFGDADTGCTHGIGHGIMEALGRENLLEALELCEASGQTNPLYGCTSGLFMEYNDAIVVDESGIRAEVRRPGGDLREPCRSGVPERHKASCYYELALWWRHLFGDDFEKVGNLCGTVEEDAYRDLCYRGWGTTVAENSSYAAENVVRICGLIQDEEGAAWCASGAALRFVGTGEHRAEAEKLCARLSGEPAADCTDHLR